MNSKEWESCRQRKNEVRTSKKTQTNNCASFFIMKKGKAVFSPFSSRVLSSLTASALHDCGHYGFLGVQPVACFVEGNALGSVDYFVGYFHPSVRWKAVHVDGLVS